MGVVSLWDDKNVLELVVNDCTTVTILKNTELYSLKGWIVYYVNNIAIKLTNCINFKRKLYNIMYVI